MGINAIKTLGHSYDKALFSYLKRLDVETRNKVRAIATLQDDRAIKILNNLRRDLSVGKLLIAEKAISALHDSESILPEKFPKTPQTFENYCRLTALPLTKQLTLINAVLKEHGAKINAFVHELGNVNKCIIRKEFTVAAIKIEKIIETYGYSHCILRKAVFVKEHLKDQKISPYIHDFLDEAAEKSKLITSSLIHCFQDEQDYLGIKRSIMALPDKGTSNKFTRDIARIPFHAHAKEQGDLEELLQSGLQSSLIDALIVLKVNIEQLELEKYSDIQKIVDSLEAISPSLEDVIQIYELNEDSEFLFFKQSSAWLESNEVIRYRYLIDHFYDSPEASYFNLSEKLTNRISRTVNCETVSCILSSERLLTDIGENLRQAICLGAITRAALFNFLTFTKRSDLKVKDCEIFPLMSRTSALDRTIHVPSIKQILPLLQCKLAKLTIRLLIAKKSKSESDHIALKSLMERILRDDFNNDFVKFFDDVADRSQEIAFYLYETCNEDFIARMTRVIKKAGDITDTRAALHIWRGEYSGESVYLDRARNLLIDSQINKIRDEIDDNRIYVDITRFTEWFNDNVSSRMSALLLMLQHSDDLEYVDNPQLLDLIEECFREFSSSNFFGIASYLGRRIRHGTFRGHLYSSVVNNIENNYSQLLNQSTILLKWNEWKENYERKVIEIIDHKLHIQSQQKKMGLLMPNLRNPAKATIAESCATTLVDHYNTCGNIYGVETIIAEACWRIAEVDLTSFNSYIKGRKPSFLAEQPLSSNKNLNLTPEGTEITRELERELRTLIAEKLTTICAWFKKPQSASPKASLSLLYKAVVSEVQQTFFDFKPDTDFKEEDDIELYGGVYHIFYDALYVIIFNAAKHGKPNGNLLREFYISSEYNKRHLRFRVLSEIKDEDDERYVLSRLEVKQGENLQYAQVIENRSGIKKLYHLQLADSKFSLEKVDCENRYVITEFAYELG
ncbi:hypothetical protein [Alteromonas sp. A079]|uniref:hypothetical protein n=1 Tax=Alteromonas sp. A079 TaxID=3410268 RepID=UPI003BA1F359